jgi:predicted dehydrogenase
MPFGTGCIGDWFCHVIDPTFWALDLDAPSTVQAEVPGFDPATQGLTYPPATKVTFEFPARNQRGPVTLVWYDGNNTIPRPASFAADDKVPGTGAILIGDKGMIMHGSHGGSSCRLLPESVMEQYSGKNAPAETLPRVKNHHWDWAEAIRTGRQAGSNFGYGARLTQVALIGAIAIRFPGQKLTWDNQKARFTNNDAANAYTHAGYRKGWKL